MPQPDPVAAAAAVKRTASLLRDARSVLRRLDALMAVARAGGDSSLPTIAMARETVENLVAQLTFREQTEQRQARQSLRHLH
jgi:hypothetical protein